MTEKQLHELLCDMTLREKIEQTVQLHGGFIGVEGLLTGPDREFKIEPGQAYRIGSILSEHGAAKLRRHQDNMMKAQPHHIPTLFMADVIHGYKTAFPVPIAIGSSFDPELAEEIASAAAAEAASAGIHVTFSPMSDLVRDGRWGRCMESTGEDSYLNARMTSAMVRGFQGDDCGKKGKVASCSKHFAAYGAVLSGRDYNVTELSTHTLYEDYLGAYRAAVDAGVEMMMTAFNTIDRKPCTTNKQLLRDLLRDEMGFEGVVISDYAAVKETITHGSSLDERDAAIKAMSAGCDIDMMSECYLNFLEDAVRDGALSESLIDEAVMRILRLKNKLGLFENPYKDGSEEDEARLCFCREHMALSERAAGETTVLLKNDGLLPLKSGMKIVVAGELSDDKRIIGSWAIFADKERTVTLKDALCERYPGADIAFFCSDEVTDELLAAAGGADAVILALGENDGDTGESQSKADISLCAAHKALFDSVYRVNKNIVVMMFGGRPIAFPDEAAKAAAVIEAWLPGSCGSFALADILFGRLNPSGRLSMSIPYATGQLPLSYSTFSTGRPKPAENGFYPFFSNYKDCPNIPLYPFGYGLSYCKTEYSAVSLDSDTLAEGGCITASVTVKNCGDIPLAETVQLYIRDVKGSVVRPLREFKGFKRISLPAGGSTVVSFVITEDMLRFYDADMNYVSEAGDFILYIGDSSLTENSAAFRLIKQP